MPWSTVPWGRDRRLTQGQSGEMRNRHCNDFRLIILDITQPCWRVSFKNKLLMRINLKLYDRKLKQKARDSFTFCLCEWQNNLHGYCATIPDDTYDDERQDIDVGYVMTKKKTAKWLTDISSFWDGLRSRSSLGNDTIPQVLHQKYESSFTQAQQFMSGDRGEKWSESHRNLIGITFKIKHKIQKSQSLIV